MNRRNTAHFVDSFLRQARHQNSAEALFANSNFEELRTTLNAMTDLFATRIRDERRIEHVFQSLVVPKVKRLCVLVCQLTTIEKKKLFKSIKPRAAANEMKDSSSCGLIWDCFVADHRALGGNATRRHRPSSTRG